MAQILDNENLEYLAKAPPNDWYSPDALREDPFVAARDTQKYWRVMINAIAETVPEETLESLLQKTRTEIAEIVRPILKETTGIVLARMNEWDLADAGNHFEHILPRETAPKLKQALPKFEGFIDDAVDAHRQRELMYGMRRDQQLSRDIFSPENMTVEHLDIYGDVQTYRLSFAKHKTIERYIKRFLGGGFTKYPTLEEDKDSQEVHDFRERQRYSEEQIQVHREPGSGNPPSRFILATNAPDVIERLDALAANRPDPENDSLWSVEL